MALKTIAHSRCCGEQSNTDERLFPASPVPHLIANNGPPSEHEVELIQEAISAAATEIRCLDSQDDQTTVSSPKLAALQKFIQDHEALLSIWRQLPPEIWSLIFESCLGGCQPNSSDCIQSIRLSSVCRLWRTLALSNPRLWRQIPLLPLMKRKGQTQSHLGYVDVMLLRGREMPISFEISAPFEELESHPVLNLMAMHCHRWGHTTISTTGVTLQLLKVIGQLSSLHTLDLDVNNLRNSPDVVTVFRDAPLLRVVKIKGLWPVKIELPWSQIEEYSEKSANPIGLAPIMESAKNLQKLSYLTYRFAVAPTDLPHTTFTKLTSLRLHFYQSGEDFGPLLDNLVLPALVDIQISNRVGDLVQQLIDLVRRSKCNLRRLAFYTHPLRPGELTQLLHLAPLLEELDVNDIPTQDLGQLASASTVPFLHSLLVHFNSSTVHADSLNIDDVAFNNLARYRCSAERTSPEKGDCVRLQKLMFVFQFPEECLASQAALEEWDELVGQHGDWETLYMCTEALRSLAPDTCGDIFGRRRQRVDPLKLVTILSTLQGLQDVDTRILMKSNVIFHLQKLRRRIRDWVPKAMQESILVKLSALDEQFVARAQKDKFMPHWVRRGEQSLVYHAEPSESSLDAKDFLNGTKETLMVQDLLWPTDECGR